MGHSAINNPEPSQDIYAHSLFATRLDLAGNLERKLVATHHHKHSAHDFVLQAGK
jgi:hypothetical protein